MTARSWWRWWGGQRGITRRPVLAVDGVDHGDPFVLRSGDRYVLYHTGATSVPVYESADLRTWTARGVALDAAGAPAWAEGDYWAPEVVRRDGAYLMYVAATRRTATGAGDDNARRVGLARADNPLGPFAWDPDPLVAEWSIDAHPFEDRGGQWWLFYSARNAATRYLDGTTGCGIAVDRLPEPGRVAGAPGVVLVPDRRWEGDRRGSWYWNEAPWVTTRGDHYCMLYSGGWYGDGTYAVGVATATDPTGPWTKHPDNPLLVSGDGIVGPGHVCLVTAPDGSTTVLVFHGRLAGRRGRAVFVSALTWTDDRFLLVPFET